MSQKVFYFAVASILFFASCEERLDDITIVRTGVVSDISPEGATFNGKITQTGKAEVAEYGFVWGTVRNPTVGHFVFTAGTGVFTGDFTSRIEIDLQKNKTYHVRAFVKTNGTVVYGDDVTFIALGAKTPKIFSVTPTQVTLGTKVTIEGEYLSSNISPENISLGDLRFDVVSSSTGKIELQISEKVWASGVYPLSITFGDAEVYLGILRYSGFEINSVSPNSGFWKDTLRLLGRFYPNEVLTSSLSLWGTNAVPKVISFTHDSIVFTLPKQMFHGPHILNLQVLTSEFRQISLETDFFFEAPSVARFEPDVAYPGQVILVKGENLEDMEYIWAHNRYSEKWPIQKDSLGRPAVYLDYDLRPGDFSVRTEWYGETIPSSAILSVKSPWTKQSNLPFGRLGYAISLKIGNKVYIGIGLGNEPGQGKFFSSLWAFDLRTESWSKATIFPGPPRQKASSFSIGNSGYIVGGVDENGSPLKDVWRYDALLNEWTKLEDFPGNARYDAVSISNGTSGFYGLGVYEQGRAEVKDFWEFDSKNDEWVRLSDYPGSGSHAMAYFTVGNAIYCGLGSTNDSPNSWKKDFWRFEIDGSGWQRLENLPSNEAYLYTSSFVIGNVGHIVASSGNQHHVWSYNTVYETWQRISNVINTSENKPYGFGTFSDNNEAYFFGGQYEEHLNNEFFKFDPTRLD